MQKQTMLLTGIALLITGIIGLVLFFPGLRHDMMGMGPGREYVSTGERIYYSGIGSDGRPIRNSHGMEGVGCAMCHGRDGQGMRMTMMEVPPLTWDYLSNPNGHSHPGRSHPSFNKTTFKACVLAGKDPAGNTLSAMMPRWEMSGRDMDSLIEYLKSLDGD